MHEMGLAQGILEIALDAAAGETVRRIELLVGRGQMVKPESLEFSFRLLADGTPSARASFTMTELPVRLRCRRCGAENEVDLLLLDCPGCGSSDVEILAGNELLVKAVELESGRIVARKDAGEA